MAYDIFGNSLTCTSPEALSLYNEAVSLFVDTTKGFNDLLERALALDGNFILSRCLMGCLICDVYSEPNPDKVQEHLQVLSPLYSQANDREKSHIDALRAASKGHIALAGKLLDNLTVKYPKDFHAVKLTFNVYKSLGEMERMRNLLARTLTHCPKDCPLYPHIMGLYAFSLEETNERAYAEELCMESLSLQPVNPWATHAMAHVIEETKEAKKGIEFLTSTRSNWNDSPYCHHLTWHLTLYYLDEGQIDKVLHEFDTVFLPKMNAQSNFNMVDLTSLLWRLNLLGINAGESRWKAVLDLYKFKVGHVIHPWLETHLMMSLSYGKVTECSARLILARQVIKSMEEYSKGTVSSDCSVADLIGVPVCNGLLAYGEERYDDVLSLMLPLRYDFIKFGGSWAQRQIFEITLIMAAINGNQLQEALALITELKARKPHSKCLLELYERVTRKMEQKEHSIETK